MTPFSLYAKLAMLAALALALAAGAWKCYTAGQNNIRAEWTAEKLATSEAARLREKAAQIQTERIDRDYQTQKARAADAQRITDDRLRDFTAAASATTIASTTSGADDPNRVIADQCAVAIATLDGYAQSLAGQVAGLQGYAREVCVSK
ncbi:MAG: hypothetical protein ACK5A0_04665 [Polaromonas sp.]|jgi:hypothetical protein